MYDLPSFIQPRMAGSSDRYSALTTISPSAISRTGSLDLLPVGGFRQADRAGGEAELLVEHGGGGHGASFEWDGADNYTANLHGRAILSNDG